MNLYLTNEENQKLTQVGVITKKDLPLQISKNVVVKTIDFDHDGNLFIETSRPVVKSGNWIVLEA